MIEGSYTGFDVAVDDQGVAVITLNQPERLNAMTFGMRRDLCEIFGLAQLDDRMRVVVIAGTGRGFCAGMFLAGDGPAEEPTLVPGRPPAQHEPVNLQAQLRLFSQELTRSIRRL